MLIWCKSKNGISKKNYQFKGMIRLDLAVVRDSQDKKSKHYARFFIFCFFICFPYLGFF